MMPVSNQRAELLDRLFDRGITPTQIRALFTQRRTPEAILCHKMLACTKCRLDLGLVGTGRGKRVAHAQRFIAFVRDTLKAPQWCIDELAAVSAEHAIVQGSKSYSGKVDLFYGDKHLGTFPTVTIDGRVY